MMGNFRPARLPAPDRARRAANGPADDARRRCQNCANWLALRKKINLQAMAGDGKASVGNDNAAPRRIQLPSALAGRGNTHSTSGRAGSSLDPGPRRAKRWFPARPATLPSSKWRCRQQRRQRRAASGAPGSTRRRQICHHSARRRSICQASGAFRPGSVPQDSHNATARIPAHRAGVIRRGKPVSQGV